MFQLQHQAFSTKDVVHFAQDAHCKNYSDTKIVQKFYEGSFSDGTRGATALLAVSAPTFASKIIWHILAFSETDSTNFHPFSMIKTQRFNKISQHLFKLFS